MVISAWLSQFNAVLLLLHFFLDIPNTRCRASATLMSLGTSLVFASVYKSEDGTSRKIIQYLQEGGCVDVDGLRQPATKVCVEYFFDLLYAEECPVNVS